jgi:hypothetical protein
MARVLLKTVQPGEPADNPWHFGPYIQFQSSARLSQGRKHRLTEDPEEADLILFADSGPDAYFYSIRKSALFRRHAGKCFVFATDDRPLALLPGVYASIENRWYDSRWTRSGFYVHTAGNHRFESLPFEENSKWLASFAGSCSNAPVRARLQDLAHPRFQLVDTSGQVIPAFSTGNTQAIENLTRTFVESVRNSKFVLCPRGVGCSSLRIFEVMCMGRCPVILSDDWVPPDGPRWEACSLRARESDVAGLPRLLEQMEPRAEKMGLRARAEWERWFSEDALFETVVDWCLAIRQGGKCDAPWFRRMKFLQLLRPFHLRHYLRYRMNR